MSTPSQELENSNTSTTSELKDDYLIRKQNMKDQLDKMQPVLEKGYSSDPIGSMKTNEAEENSTSIGNQRQDQTSHDQTDSEIQTTEEKRDEQTAGQDGQNNQKEHGSSSNIKPPSITNEMEENYTSLEKRSHTNIVTSFSAKENPPSQKPTNDQTDSEIQTTEEKHDEQTAGQERQTCELQGESKRATQQDPDKEIGTMLTLLQKIEKYDAHAASVLKKEDFQTDFEIQILTKEDLNELFPGKDKWEMTNLIFQIIHKQVGKASSHPWIFKHILKDFLFCLTQKPTQEEPEGVTKPKSLKDVVIAVCLHWIEDTKKQLDEKESDIKRPENSDKSLRSKTDAHFQTDSVIQTFTREGLQKLFPGPNNFKLRKFIFEILHNQATYLLLGESGDFTQQDSVKDDYLIRKQNMKDQLDKMQAVLEKGYVSETKAPMTTKKENRLIRFFGGQPRKPQVKYKMVVCGETFGAHHQLLDKIQTPDLSLIKEKDEESCITIVFCPVVSRSGTDAEAAIKKVPGDGPVLLVLMHYSQESKHVSSSKVLSGYSNVLLEVNIFYHDKKNGLLKCEQNQNAVTELKKELKKYSKTQSSGSYKKK